MGEGSTIPIKVWETSFTSNNRRVVASNASCNRTIAASEAPSSGPADPEAPVGPRPGPVDPEAPDVVCAGNAFHASTYLHQLSPAALSISTDALAQDVAGSPSASTERLTSVSSVFESFLPLDQTVPCIRRIITFEACVGLFDADVRNEIQKVA